MIMAGEASALLKWTLKIYGTIGVVYGAVFFFVPGAYIAFSGADPVAYGWMRWPGGMLMAYGLGIVLISRKSEGQGLFVATAARAATLMGLALLYTMIAGEYTSRLSSVIVAMAINLVGAACLWYGRAQSREAL